MALTIEEAKRIIEAALFYSREPMPIKKLLEIFSEEEEMNAGGIKDVIALIQEDYRERGIELVEVASGFRFQVRADMSPWVTRLMAEKPARYSRALLETLALIAYKQPITRAEIEEVRGVAVSTNIIRTLEEREWIKVIGHRDVPGKPALFATTKTFLDDMNLTSLSELPTLAEIQDLDDGQLTQQLQLALNEEQGSSDNEAETQSEETEITSGETETQIETETESEVQVEVIAQSEAVEVVEELNEEQESEEVEEELEAESEEDFDDSLDDILEEILDVDKEKDEEHEYY